MSNNAKPKVSPIKLVMERAPPAKNKKQGKPRKQPAQGRRTEIVSGGLSPCCKDYAAALVDPFDGPLTCVPSAFPPIPSFKTRVWVRGQVSTGTLGVGFVAVAPNNMFANNGQGVIISGPSYAQNGFPATTADVGVQVLSSNAPYNVAAIGDTPLGVQYRMVSIGVRTWYIGSELNLQGEMYGFRQPDNVSLLGLSNTTLLAFPSTRRVVVTSERAPLDVTWIPTKPAELEFWGTVAGSYSLGITLTGPAASTNIFGFEVFGIAEYIGSTVPQRTPSHADPAGFAAILTTAQRNGDTWYGDARAAASNLLSQAGGALRELSGSKFGQAAARAAVGITAAYFGLPSAGIGPQTAIDSRRLPQPPVTVTEIEDLKRNGPPIRTRETTVARYETWREKEGPVFSLSDWMKSQDYRDYMTSTSAGPDGSL